MIGCFEDVWLESQRARRRVSGQSQGLEQSQGYDKMGVVRSNEGHLGVRAS